MGLPSLDPVPPSSRAPTQVPVVGRLLILRQGPDLCQRPAACTLRVGGQQRPAAWGVRGLAGPRQSVPRVGRCLALTGIAASRERPATASAKGRFQREGHDGFCDASVCALALPLACGAEVRRTSSLGRRSWVGGAPRGHGRLGRGRCWRCQALRLRLFGDLATRLRGLARRWQLGPLTPVVEQSLG